MSSLHEKRTQRFTDAMETIQSERTDISNFRPLLLHLAYDSLWVATCTLTATWGSEGKVLLGIGPNFVVLHPNEARAITDDLMDVVRNEEEL